MFGQNASGKGGKGSGKCFEQFSPIQECRFLVKELYFLTKCPKGGGDCKSFWRPFYRLCCDELYFWTTSGYLKVLEHRNTIQRLLLFSEVKGFAVLLQFTKVCKSAPLLPKIKGGLVLDGIQTSIYSNNNTFVKSLNATRTFN